MAIKTEPTVFIVDDDENMRHSLSRLCKSVGLHAEIFSTAQQLLGNCDPERHGCLVTDIRMPGMSGLDLQSRLREQGITIPVIMITGYGDVATAVRAMKGGAVEFLEKPFSNQELLDCIHKCLELDMRIKSKLQRHKQIIGRFDTLTAREREVMELVVEGKTNKSIAVELAISSKTVEAHRFRLMDKMQAKTVVELTKMYLELRLEEVEEGSHEDSPA